MVLSNDNSNIRSSLNSKEREMNCLIRSKRESIISNVKKIWMETVKEYNLKYNPAF